MRRKSWKRRASFDMADLAGEWVLFLCGFHVKTLPHPCSIGQAYQPSHLSQMPCKNRLISSVTHMRKNPSRKPLKLLARSSSLPVRRAISDSVWRPRHCQSKKHHIRGVFLLLGILPTKMSFSDVKSDSDDKKEEEDENKDYPFTSGRMYF